MQQAISSGFGSTSRTDQTARMSRQARVGIIANTNAVALPVHPPREIWVRWPKLRSARKRAGVEGTQAEPPLDVDPILSGAALHDFVREIRAPEADAPSVPNLSVSKTAMAAILSPNAFPPDAKPLPPGNALIPFIRLGLAVLAFALGLIGISLLL